MTTRISKTLVKDPLNLVIAGVAGQGNIVISLLLGNALVNEGYLVMFGQSFGSNQRGGSVRNYLRISRETMYSPIVPYGHADIIVSMEPMEAMRMLMEFGNPNVITIVNPRAIASSGKSEYPDLDRLLADIRKASARILIVNATEEALKLGNPILANIVLVGAMVGAGILPIDKESVAPELRERFPRAIELNMRALDRGMELAEGQ